MTEFPRIEADAGRIAAPTLTLCSLVTSRTLKILSEFVGSS